MKNVWVLFFSIFYLTSCGNVSSFNAEGTKIWEKTYDESGSGDIRSLTGDILSLTSTPDDGALLGGNTRFSGAGKTDMYLIRVDGDGNKLWEKTYGGANWDYINELVLTPDSGALLGGKTNLNDNGKPDMYLVRVDGDGNKIWEKTYSSSQKNWISSLVLTRDGGVLLGGTKRRDTGIFDMYLVRIE